MADDRRRSGSGFGFKFFLFIVYVAAYVFLRSKGEITIQQIALPAPNGGTEIFRMVGAHPDLPHWRQQLWRAVFSFAMVGEEEGRKLLNQGMDTYRGARAPSSGGGQNYYSGAQNQNGYPGIQNPNQGRQNQNVYSAQGYPTGQNMYSGQQFSGAQSNPGERVIWDGRNQSVNELPANVRRPLSAAVKVQSDKE